MFFSSRRGATMIEDDFLLVNPRERSLSHPYPGITPTPGMISSGFNAPEFMVGQTGRGTNVVSFARVTQEFAFYMLCVGAM